MSMLSTRYGKILAVVLVINCGALQTKGSVHDQVKSGPDAESKDIVGNVKKSADIDVKINGRVRQDFFFYERPFTLQDNLQDRYSYFRSKIEGVLNAQQGLEKYGKAAAEASIKYSAYNYWQSNDRYVKTSFVKEHNHDYVLPLIYLEEAWLNIHFGTFAKALKDLNLSFKAGYFPYAVGRGLSLGLHEDMALTHGGWQGDFGYTRFASMPPGFLLKSQLTHDLSVDLYFNRWRAASYGPESVVNPIYSYTLDEKFYRGHGHDRDSWVVKVDYQHKTEKDKKIALQPYFVYTRAPELPVEFDHDSKATLGTFGFMTDYTHKNFNINVELAAQYGTHEIFAIDRNTIQSQTNNTTGVTESVYSHVFTNNDFAKPVKAMVTSDIASHVNDAANRSIERNGQQIIGTSGTYYNSDVFGNARFRNAYKLRYQGIMGLADASYTTDSKALTFAGALAHIGGDKYPFNEEQNHPFKAFIAQRALYFGHHVKSIIIFERLVLPRPKDISYRLGYAEDEYRDYSDLQYIGASLTWRPMKEKNMCSIQPNLLAFWQPATIKKWDKNGKHSNPLVEAQLDSLRKKIGFKGWQSNEDASHFLGVEGNVICNYNILSNCMTYVKAWLFAPGQLYKDLEGQPNRFTRRTTKEGTAFNPGLGTKCTWGFYLGFDYKF